MPKQQSLSTRSPSQKEKPRKAILRTADLLKQNGRDKGKGKEKDKAVWGELNELIHGELEAVSCWRNSTHSTGLQAQRIYLVPFR